MTDVHTAGVKVFVEYGSHTRAEAEVHGLVVLLITRVMARNFLDAKVMPFESFETKLVLGVSIHLSPPFAVSGSLNQNHAY